MLELDNSGGTRSECYPSESRQDDLAARLVRLALPLSNDGARWVDPALAERHEERNGLLLQSLVFQVRLNASRIRKAIVALFHYARARFEAWRVRTFGKRERGRGKG